MREIQVENGVKMRANVDKKIQAADLALHDYAITMYDQYTEGKITLLHDVSVMGQKFQMN